jgi:hypothetical protein
MSMRPRRIGSAMNACSQRLEHLMKAMADLFSTDYGLFSVAGLAFMMGMAIWFYRFFNRKMEESERAQRTQGR